MHCRCELAGRDLCEECSNHCFLLACLHVYKSPKLICIHACLEEIKYMGKKLGIVANEKCGVGDSFPTSILHVSTWPFPYIC